MEVGADKLYGEKLQWEKWCSCSFLRKEINLHICAISRLYIDVDVNESDGFVWRFTRFYGECSSDKKVVSWQSTMNSKCGAQKAMVVHGRFQ